MRIGIVGGGVVGQATAHVYRGWADEVRVYDVDKARRTVESERHVWDCDLVFICLPESEVGYYFATLPDARLKGNYVLKSTVPIGTTRRLAESYDLPNLVHSPEFLTERCALVDALTPRANVVGELTRSTKWTDCGRTLYELYLHRFPGAPVLVMTSDESEAVKLFTNAYGSVLVSLFNEFRSLADARQLDWRTVLAGMLAQGRIPHAYTDVPGPDGKRGWGGRCFPKDLDTLIDCFDRTFSDEGDTRLPPVPHLLRAAQTRNQRDRKA